MRTLTATLLAALIASGCDDTDFHGHEPGASVDCDAGADACTVQTIYEAHCISCHSAGGAAGGLDLETDPYAATVGVEAAAVPGATLVEPGSPEDSLLFRKVRGTMGDDEGGIMPPGTDGLSTRELALIWEWIEAGATDSCEGEPDTGLDSGGSR